MHQALDKILTFDGLYRSRWSSTPCNALALDRHIEHRADSEVGDLLRNHTLLPKFEDDLVKHLVLSHWSDTGLKSLDSEADLWHGRCLARCSASPRQKTLPAIEKLHCVRQD